MLPLLGRSRSLLLLLLNAAGSFLSSVLRVTDAALPEKKEGFLPRKKKDQRTILAVIAVDLQIHTTVASESGNDFNFSVFLWTGGQTSRLTPDFSIPDSRSPWIGFRGASSKLSLFISRKMKAVLVQNKIAPAICSPEKYPESWKGEVLSEKLGDAHNCLTLHLTDNVLREIDEKDNAFEIWTKLEKLYLGKFLSNKIYLKE
ncbi:hypothetical protein M9H77_07398 [Catharanthus roseus]|uniref:Uncharacterized protein n=1 Tax=Catharanthus roseus TaxID=4058 RepID=A0ACC0BUV1_CATRO|nr:hypothetical protein M9H77_07398 [Catharanthus roseus]